MAQLENDPGQVHAPSDYVDGQMQLQPAHGPVGVQRSVHQPTQDVVQFRHGPDQPVAYRLPDETPVIIDDGTLAEDISRAPSASTGTLSLSTGSFFDQSISEFREFPIPTQIRIRRECTDSFCILLFAVFLAGWGFVAFCGFMWGKPERLLHPADSMGRTCGTRRHGYYDLRKKPYLLLFDPTKCLSHSLFFARCHTPQICVAKCPLHWFSYLEMQNVRGAAFQKELKKKLVCTPDVSVSNILDFASLKAHVDNNSCASYTVRSVAVMQRCLPEALFNLSQSLADAETGISLVLGVTEPPGNISSLIPDDELLANSSSLVRVLLMQTGVIEKIAADLSVCWHQILLLLSLAAVLSFIWTVVMRFCVIILVWCSVAIVCLTLLGGAAYCWLRYRTLIGLRALDDYSFQPNVALYFEMPSVWLAFAMILTSVLAIIILSLVLIRKRVFLAVSLIKESSKAIGGMMALLVFPLIPFVEHMAVFAMCGAVAVWLATSAKENCRRPLLPGGDPRDGALCDCSLLGTGQDMGCEYVNLTRLGVAVIGMHMYNLFGLLWGSYIVSGFSDLTLAGAFTSYYWTMSKNDLPCCPLVRSYFRTLRYHSGTAVCGSFILTLVKYIQIVIELLERRSIAAKNVIAKFFLKCVKCCCCCGCLHAVLKNVSRKAYVMTALYGKNFCASARFSSILIFKNIERYIILDYVTYFFLFLGKLSITLMMGAIAFYWFRGLWNVDGLMEVKLYYHFVPTVIVTICSYVVADSFFNVYDIAVDATFLCFLVDAENNDGSPEKPYFMSQELQRIVGKQYQVKTPRAADHCIRCDDQTKTPRAADHCNQRDRRPLHLV